MRRLQAQLIFLTAAVAIVAMPAAAMAERVVPPGNSAATQYTETFPTAKGPAATKKRGKGANRSPREALGSRNVRELRSQGQDGRDLAEVVAETAPSGATTPSQERQAVAKDTGRVSREQADDSSSLGEVVAQATGSSDSGGMGLALPLLILAVFAAFAVHLWRRRRLAA
jgi:hypothetical protein